MTKLFTAVLFMLVLMAEAQEFKASGKLEHTKQDGFYKVSLSPAEARYINIGFTNIRILDSKNAQVPYILTEEKPVYLQQQFKEYEILEKKQQTKAYTTLKLHNPDQTSIDNISLLIKNAEVSKSARLSGSDDGKTWFAVKENFTLSHINNQASVSELRAIEFPRTNYSYYLLEISDSTSSPINIQKAGYYDVSATHGLYSEVNSFQLSSETNNKRTYLNLKFSSPQLIDKLELTLTGSPFFQRQGVITTKESRKVKKGFEQYDAHLQDFIVRSGQTTVISFTNLKTDNLTFAIENGDNPPLSVQDLKVYQLNRYLIAWLKKDETYTVRFGNDNQTSPEYDLEYFRDSIPAHVQVLQIKNAEPVQPDSAPESTTIFTSKAIIWIAIGAVIILLGFMSLRLVRETSEKQDS